MNSDLEECWGAWLKFRGIPGKYIPGRLGYCSFETFKMCIEFGNVHRDHPTREFCFFEGWKIGRKIEETDDVLAAELSSAASEEGE